MYPGWVRTVNLGMGFDLDAAGLSMSDFEQMTQSPYLIGRAIAELFADREVQSKSGKTLYAGEVAVEDRLHRH